MVKRNDHTRTVDVVVLVVTVLVVVVEVVVMGGVSPAYALTPF
jgi:hypothetical protein